MCTPDINLEFELDDNVVASEEIKKMSDEELQKYIEKLEADAAMRKQSGITYGCHN